MRVENAKERLKRELQMLRRKLRARASMLIVKRSAVNRKRVSNNLMINES